MATNPHDRLLRPEEFLQIRFPPDMKAELEDGVIRMMAGNGRAHARVQMNLYAFMRDALRGSGCRPFGSDMGVRTVDRGVRYPDVSVDCGSSDDRAEDLVLRDPRVIIEVLSPSTRDHDLKVKKPEYPEVVSVRTIAFVDPEAETISISQRVDGGWTDSLFASADLPLPELGVVVPHAEIFAAD